MDESNDWEAIFNSAVREFVIYLLLFICLHFSSYALISAFKKKVIFYASDYDDAVVYRVSFMLCTFSLSVSIGAALLLPLSIISNEVLHFYPNSYYIQWLNSSLIQGLWNLVFLFSNVSLFVVLPFAYFFTESQGFPGTYRGVKARLCETCSVLLLFGLLIFGITCILSAFLDYGRLNFESLFNIWSYYLPFLYSCVSFLGVLLLLLCTPVGFAQLFTVVGKLIIKPEVFTDVHSDNFFTENDVMNSDIFNACDDGFHETSYEKRFKLKNLSFMEFEKRLAASHIRRNFVYPIAMIFLLTFTVISVLMVTQNILGLCFGIKTLPLYSQKVTLGLSSLSVLGAVGAFLEIFIVLYLWCSSVVGFYSLPIFHLLRPQLRNTSLTSIIGNCAVLLVLSSALPVLARILGITNFDLLGDFGRIYWLGNFYIVLFYNIVFAVATAICLGTKITATVRQELVQRLYFLANMRFLNGSLCSNKNSSFIKED